MNRTLVALNVPRRIPEFLAYAHSVAAAMSKNPVFQPLIPTLATFEADIAALEAAHIRTYTRASGLAKERDAKLATVALDLASLAMYVQAVADASPGEAEALIASAGLHVKGSSGHPKPNFVAKQGRTSSTARLLVKAPRVRTSYDWQQSSDGESWIDLPRTMRADADVSELVAGSRYFFRYRTLTKEGVSDWSQVV